MDARALRRKDAFEAKGHGEIPSRDPWISDREAGESRGANPSTRGPGWANLWCTGCYANSGAGQLSWYGSSHAKWEILLYTSSRTRFLNENFDRREV
ncbi:hypothetical protein RND71_015910 [Anisodus tanguticus]|uniref:Uncharacterized protein n=1 Tax=Anisodus tanguticus TaxID=243964 RepID=A0AAE1VDA6_9SOLA|nr:hypothetical protein RND71_015910 [Anisodus tanguticus]